MFSITIGKYTLLCDPNGLPENFDGYVSHAKVADQEHLTGTQGKVCCVGVQVGGGWPFLVIAQRYSPAGFGFNPGAILVPETDLLLIGAGERLLAYKLDPPKKLWEDKADTGFWGWQRHDNVLLMSAELELAAWDIQGKKLWTKFVEPPWEYEIVDGEVRLDVMGQKSSFQLATGK